MKFFILINLANTHCETMFGYYKCVDLLTGMTYLGRDITTLRRVSEDVAMYNRHSDGTMEFSCVVVGNERDAKAHPRYQSIFFEESYQPNPFDSTLQKDRYKTSVIPKSFNDPRDGPLTITFDNIAEERSWVKDMFNFIADRLYQECLDNNNTLYKTYGSLCHRGLVNKIFNYQHTGNMNNKREWITVIGDTFNPEKFKEIEGWHGDSIYEGGFFTKEVKQLCEYCEIMFGVSRFEVAKLFPKKDPSKFLNTEGSKSKIAYNTQNAAAIYAENGDYEKALEYYRKAVDMLDGERCQHNYQRKLDDFLQFYEKHGTTVLSSSF